MQDIQPWKALIEGFNEAIPALKARHLRWVLGRHDFFERFWPSVAPRELPEEGAA